jgi:hypothetical protein
MVSTSISNVRDATRLWQKGGGHHTLYILANHGYPDTLSGKDKTWQPYPSDTPCSRPRHPAPAVRTGFDILSIMATKMGGREEQRDDGEAAPAPRISNSGA